MIKSDSWIKRMSQEHDPPLITPFINHQVREEYTHASSYQVGGWLKVVSYGLSSYGYDCRLSGESFKISSPINGSEIDPLRFNEKSLIDTDKLSDNRGEYFLLPPNHYGLGMTEEWFNLPRNVIMIASNKSTMARCGIIQPTTIGEPEWKGRLVIELFNGSQLPLRLWIGHGIIQAIFLEADENCLVSYQDRKGKYQNQTSLTLPKV